MAITYASLIDSLSTSNFGTGAAATAAFTPTAGRRLVAVVGGQENNGTTDPSADFTISDSQNLTWTKIGDVGNPGNWSHGMVGWISTGAAAASTTVTFDCAARNVWRYFYAIIEVSGASGFINGYIENSAATSDGAYTVTLPATPSPDDLTVFARLLDSATSGLTMGAGWTIVGNQGDSSGGGAMAVAVRPSSTSTSVSIVDASTVTASPGKSSDFAWIITATVPRVLPGTTYRARLTRAANF